MAKTFDVSEDKESSTREETEYKHPDMIIIDGEQENVSQDSFQEKDDPRKRKFSMNQRILSPRLFSCLGFLFSFLFGLLILMGSLPSLFFAALFLFRSQALNQVVKKLWMLSSNAFIVSMGFLLAILSPPLGFGLILLYLSWHAGHDRFTQTVRRFFSN